MLVLFDFFAKLFGVIVTAQRCSPPSVRSATFDTLVYSKRLRIAGFTEQQAEVPLKHKKKPLKWS